MFEQREITYSTGETEELTGTSQKQIIYWEKKGLFPKTERNVCGDIAYRRFTQSQVEIIRAIKGYLDQGYTLARAAELARNGKGSAKMANSYKL
jgi:DNA-binding transcriptional MerR regulator